MPYNPKGFNDIGGDASMAPSELQPPLNFADGGSVSWAGDSTVYNTQSQIGNMLATPGGFSGMSRQFTSPSPMAMAEGGDVKTRLAAEFAKRGLDLNKFIERRAYAYGGDVRDGDNPGGLSGDTGAYGGRSSGGSDAGFSARAGDTPGFGSGGGGSVGGGGGYGAGSDGSPAGGGDRGDRGDRDVSFFDTVSNAAKNLFNVGPAEQPPFDLSAYQQKYQFNPVVTQTPFEKAQWEANVGEVLSEAEANAPFARTGFPTGLGALAVSPALPTELTQPAQQATTFNKDQSGIVPAGVWTGPELPDINQAAEAARVAAAQPADTFYTDLQRVNDKLAAIRNMDQTSAVNAPEAAKPSPLEAYSQVKSVPTSPFESAVKAALSPAPTESPYNYTPTFTPAPVSKVNMSNYDQTGDKQMLPSVDQQPVAAEPAVQPVTVAQVAAAPVLAAAKKAAATTPAATAPAVQKGALDQIMSGMDAANAKRITELEQANKFAGGNKAQVASALGVDPSELKSRIVTQDGQQKVDYYTKGLDQVLSEMVSGPFNAISNLFGGGNYDLKNGYSITPSGDVIKTPVSTAPVGGGGGNDRGNDRGSAMQAQIATPVQAAAVTPPVTPAPTTPLTTFSRKYIPLTNYAQYGYGPEASFYNYAAAKGGPVGPLSQKRK
jgi:hypothetical protein